MLQPIGWTFRLLEFWSPAVRAIRLALTWRMRTGYLSDDSTTTIRYLDRTVIPHIRPGCAYGGHNSPYLSALSEFDFDFTMSSDADAAAETVALFQNLSVQAARLAMILADTAEQLYQRLLLPGSLGCVQAVASSSSST